MDLGISELLFILFLALLLFGPNRLPEIGRQIGKFVAEFKKAGNQFRAQLEEEVRQLDAEQQQAKALKGEAVETQRSMAEDLASVTETLRDLRNMKGTLTREITQTLMAPPTAGPANTIAKGSLKPATSSTTSATSAPAPPKEEPNA
jgi:sec-independent protein translocase protein TatB